MESIRDTGVFIEIQLIYTVNMGVGQAKLLGRALALLQSTGKYDYIGSY